jgi:hypothetical protein
MCFILRNSVDLVGISPRIIFDPETPSISLKSKNEGKILRNGVNVWFSSNIKEGLLETQWLPGGASVYRYSVIKEIRFNPDLESKSLGGYALGDDVDFSLQSSQFGKLSFAADISVVHKDLYTNSRYKREYFSSLGRWKKYLMQFENLEISPWFVVTYHFLIHLKSIFVRRNLSEIGFFYSFITAFLDFQINKPIQKAPKK